MKAQLHYSSNFKCLCTFLMLSLFPLISSAQSFNIKGNFEGENTKELVLNYHNESGDPVIDTLQIQNGKFETTGTIGGVQQVFLKGKTESNSMEDPNFGFFFLEPGDLKISLVENNFQQMKVEGSPTHVEWKKIDKEQAVVRKEMDDISQKLTVLASKPGSNNEEKRKLEEQWQKNIENQKKDQLEYAYANPDSYLSAYFVNFYKRNLSRDSLSSFYSKFSPRVKNTVYAEAVSKMVGANTGVSNTKAIPFTSKDHTGKEISLEDFKGNYVLLDFWAGWCKPCLEKHPILKEVYKEYHQKGFDILGVSFDASKEEWRKSIKEENLDLWQHVFVGLDKVRMEGSISSLYGIQPIPAYILLDKNGIVLEKYMAADSSRKSLEDLKTKLDELLK